MIVVSGNGECAEPRPWDAVEKRQGIFQTAVVVQEIACMNEQIELCASGGAAYLLDLRVFTAISPAKVRIRNMKDAQPFVGQPVPIAHQSHC